MSEAAAVEAAPVEARGLVKRYGELTAVAGVDLTVERGDVFGYLGPNGAGKTTSLRMLLGLIRPTEGAVRLFGRDPILDGASSARRRRRVRPRDRGLSLSVRPQEPAAAHAMISTAVRASRASMRVLDVVRAPRSLPDRVGGYSRDAPAASASRYLLLRRPKLLLLDEPTTGLDPAGMRDMRELVKRLAGDGITILLSSHILDEVEELCNRVAIIRRGTIIYEGLLQELLASAGGSYRLSTTDTERARALLLARGFEAVQVVGSELRFQADVAAIEAATVALGEAGIGISALVPHTATLEELFLGMTDEQAAA